MKHLRNIDIREKKVLVRCDYNVSLDSQGNILDDSRIRRTLKTIKHLIKNKAKVILISHLGRPKPVCQKMTRAQNCNEYSLEPISKKLSDLLGQEVKFIDDCIGEKVEKEIAQMKPGEALLLENLRFYKEEQENNAEFAKKLGQLADIYVNDAFAVCHRRHSSVVGVARHLPSASGFLLEEEIINLSKITKNPSRPLVVIIGGVKMKSKIGVIDNLLDRADHVLLGGMIANVVLAVKGICAFGPKSDPEIRKKIKAIDLASSKLFLPIDGLIVKSLNNGQARKGSVDSLVKGENMFDIGPKTIKVFLEIIKEAKTIFWNGPLGYIEDPRFAKGTLQAAKAIAKSRTFAVLGGGDTDGFLHSRNLKDKFDYVSTGGGAMLEFLAGEKLPGLEALK